MIPANKRSQNIRINLNCPVCGMTLDDPRSEGFAKGTETYCCQGCAEGSGCTCCDPRIPVSRGGNRRGTIGKRNPENSVRDRNFNQEVSTSGRPIGSGNRRETRKTPSRIPHRGDLLADGSKAPRSQSEQRPSAVEPARGRSEFRGTLNKRLNSAGGMDRISETATKGASPGRRRRGTDKRRVTRSRRSTKPRLA
jgi:hypothetical protein